MKVVLGSDHRGVALRGKLAIWLAGRGHDTEFVGAQDDQAYDYPNASDEVARRILAGEAALGVLICGSGIGVSIRANRHRGIRAALACSPEHAAASRRHNHANVLCIGSDFTLAERAIGLLEAFLDTPVDEAERHVRRVEMLDR